jgi:hypothetical protein
VSRGVGARRLVSGEAVGLRRSVTTSATHLASPGGRELGRASATVPVDSLPVIADSLPVIAAGLAAVSLGVVWSSRDGRVVVR